MLVVEWNKNICSVYSLPPYQAPEEMNPRSWTMTSYLAISAVTILVTVSVVFGMTFWKV